MARPNLTKQEAFNLIDTYLNKEAKEVGLQGNYPFMFGYAESLLAHILVGDGEDLIKDLYNRITKE